MTIVTCKLKGGLGNQLFQIFTTIAYCLRFKRKFMFAFSEKLFIGKERNTYWNTFLSELLKFTNRSSCLSNDELFILPEYCEKGFNYHPIPEWSSDFSFSLNGYFQSYLYFPEEQQIFKMIRLSEQKEDVFREFSHYFDGITISMHFRLGDYKTKQMYHPILSNSYYFNALTHLSNHLEKKIRVLYFCEKEDNAEVNEKIKNLTFPFEFIKVDDSISDWKQLLLMSLCDHHIIANSTFSWWGAYLNENPKIVCYPSVWFGPKLTHNVNDLFPISWTCIPCIS